MKKEEIEEFINFRCKKSVKHFQKAINNFEGDSIFEFRKKISRLKVFLHLVSMESDDGLSCHITRKMKVDIQELKTQVAGELSAIHTCVGNLKELALHE